MSERCPICATEIDSVSTRGPTDHTLSPCGHTAAIDLKTATGGRN
jgi:hypothetical protein